MSYIPAILSALGEGWRQKDREIFFLIYEEYIINEEINSLTVLYTHDILITLSPHLLASPSHRFQPFFLGVPHELVAFILFYNTFI